MLRKTICACVLVLAGLLLMGCSRQNESKKPQAEQTNESNILDHFVIEKRDDSAQEEERISMSLDDLKKHPKKEESSEEETESKEEESTEQEESEESDSSKGSSYEFYRGGGAGESDLGDPIEFDVEMEPVFEGSDNSK